MKKPLFLLFFFVALSALALKYTVFQDDKKEDKIVALLRIRNESLILEQCLKALSLYADAIILLDDASEDNSLEIAQNLAKICNIEKIVATDTWNINEKRDRNNLLQLGREIGGTHFIFLDADEMFTADSLKDNFLRKKILSLNPGEKISMMWIQLWRGIDKFKIDGGVTVKNFIICDDGKFQYPDQFFTYKGKTYKKCMHCPRTPTSPDEKIVDLHSHHVLHFQGVNYKNMQIRTASYRCREHIKNPHILPEHINKNYARMTNEQNIKLRRTPKQWFDGYDFFDKTAFEKIDRWKVKQLCGWFQEYGRDFFEGLDLAGLENIEEIKQTIELASC
ncbi:glycosyltransferase family 2 protein [Candidatus Dependentiae bacterium]